MINHKTALRGMIISTAHSCSGDPKLNRNAKIRTRVRRFGWKSSRPDKFKQVFEKSELQLSPMKTIKLGSNPGSGKNFRLQKNQLTRNWSLRVRPEKSQAIWPRMNQQKNQFLSMN